MHTFEEIRKQTNKQTDATDAAIPGGNWPIKTE